MTVTRKQRDMESVAEIFRNPQGLELKPKGQLTTPEHLLPQWAGILLQMAQDKRHDLAAGTLRFWTEKLKKYPELTICRALMTGRWNLFPSVDQVITVIEELQRVENDFIPCPQCVNGWKTVELPSPLYKSGKTWQAVRCECWHKWAKESVVTQEAISEYLG